MQLSLRPGMVEFGWGHPDAAFLPVDGMAEAAALALRRRGVSALSYGAEQGPGLLIELIRARCGQVDGVAPPAAQLMITGGTSQALDMLCTHLSRPGDVALVEMPTYHLALRIFRDYGLRLIGVPSDEQGIHVEAAESLARMARARGERVAFLYTVATFANPTGATLSSERRLALANLAQREGLLVFEDAAYAELWYDEPPPPPVYGFAPAGPIVRLGSFAKVLAPGLRLGWMQADPAVIARCVGSGLLDSGGGVNHFTAHTVAAFLELGLLDGHIARLRETLRGRRDALLAALGRWMPADCAWSAGRGGFFIWVKLPPTVDSAALLPIAESCGVSFLPGERFYAERGGQHRLRLSFSLLPPDQLEEGARRLGEALRR